MRCGFIGYMMGEKLAMSGDLLAIRWGENWL